MHVSLCSWVRYVHVQFLSTLSTHVHTHAHTHARTHTRAHTHTHTHMHAQTCVSKYTCTLQAHIRRCARETSYFPYTGFSLLLYWHMQVNILADADMDEHWHVRVYVREHACMHACARECVCVFVCARTCFTCSLCMLLLVHLCPFTNRPSRWTGIHLCCKHVECFDTAHELRFAEFLLPP